jgi:predicted metal-dependent peptidase
MDKEISAHLLKLRRSHPFLATISLFAQYQFNNRIEQFETDGIYISINPDYFNRLQSSEKTGLILHMTLHTALLHAQRVALRNESVWNIAADIVVNNIIIESGGFKVPPQTAVETKYTDLSVEQVYEALMHLHNKSAVIKDAMMVESSGSQQSSGSSPSSSQIQSVMERLYPCNKDLAGNNSDSKNYTISETSNAKTQQYWQSAFRKAEAAMRFGSKQQGDLPEALLREINKILNAELDWRWVLWNFVVRTPSDFEGFDRRFMHQGLYLDKLESDRLNVMVAVDTSGSIKEAELTRFVSELVAITSAYHVINVIFYYVDAEIYGPYELEVGMKTSTPRGGGGTDFSVFYDKVVNNYDANELDVIVYFTDGYGHFPQEVPSIETLWVVTSGGLETEHFPFGQVARLAE